MQPLHDQRRKPTTMQDLKSGNLELRAGTGQYFCLGVLTLELLAPQY